MGKVFIDYYGHSCFGVSNEEGSAVFDPYDTGSVPGTRLPEGITADAVYCSHDHKDHNAKRLIRITGNAPLFPVSFLTVPHDDAEGRKRGMCNITFCRVSGITIAHLGDLGRLPDIAEIDRLREAQVVMIPCGGYYTIDADQARLIIEHLAHPCLKILMHYRDGRRGYDVLEDIRDIMKKIPDVEQIDEHRIALDPEKIPDQTITLNPIK